MGLHTNDVHLGKCNCLGTKKAHLIVREGKTDAASRRVPIAASVVSALDNYIKDWRPSKADGALFLNNHGDEFSEDGWSSIFRRIKGRLPKSIDFKLHRARNTALTTGIAPAWTSGRWDISRVTHASNTPSVIWARSLLLRSTQYLTPSLEFARRVDLSPSANHPV
jgi:integrase